MSKTVSTKGTPEWVMRFAQAVRPDYPELLLSTNEENILTAAADKIEKLTAECNKLKQENIEQAALIWSYKEGREQVRAERDKLLKALDDIVTAAALPGDHCELNDAIKAARNLLEAQR